MQVLALDVGSSSIKAALLDLDALVIGEMAQQPFPGPRAGLPPGRHEVDADEVVERCRQVIADLLRSAQPQAILLCGQHGGYVLVEAAGGRRVSDFVSWRDQRTAEPCPGDADGRSVHEVLAAELGADLLLGIGNELAPGGTLTLLYWLRRHGALRPGVVPMGIGEYVLMRLGGGSPVLEPTCAVGLVEVATMTPARRAFTCAGLDGVIWPELRTYRQPAGALTWNGWAIPLHPVVGDHQCALAGAGLAERELSINVSTGSQVSLLTLRAEAGRGYQTRAFFDGLLLNTVTHLPAGRALNVLVELLCELPRVAGAPLADPWRWINELVETAAPSDLSARLSFFKGPMGSRGEIANIGVDNLTVGTLFRSAFADMAGNYARAAAWIDPAAGWERIVFSGGLVQKIATLRNAIAARFTAPQRLCQTSEETLRGMLALGLVIGGRAASLSAANRLLG